MNDFILPDIGEGIVECELLKWLIAEGDTVVEDQPIAEVMTDKATVEIPAMHNGVVSKLYYKEGDIAKVHAPLFAMQITDEDSAVAPTNDASLPLIEVERSASTAISSGAVKIESFILPDIGEGIVECEIMEWLIKEGDIVVEDQVVVEVMTDKAVVEIPAKYNGRISKLHYNKGDIAGVHTPLFDQEIQDSSHTFDAASKQNDERVEASVNIDIQHSTLLPNDNVNLESGRQQGENHVPEADVSRAIASPAVRRLARQKGVSLNNIKGSGPKGRVVKQDVSLAAFASESTYLPLPSEQQSPLPTQSFETTPSLVEQSQSSDRVESIKGIRAAMAKQMVASVSTIPHFTVSDELCMDNLIALRKKLQPIFEADAAKLSFLPFFIKALSLAMKSFPIINSRLNDAGNELTYLSAHNIGIAVDSKIGLLVPNIKNVESRSLFDIAQALNDIIERARVGKLTNAELSNGSISISNIGAIGGITATPVINKPDVAIVALGKTQRLPRFAENGDVVASSIMMVNWSGDHRVIDGATMVKFNNLWMDYLCHPEKMLVHLR